MHRELFEKRKWISNDDFTLCFALARLTPGTNLLAFCTGWGWLLCEAVLADIGALGINEVVNLGDHVSGPLEAARTADLLIERGFPSVRGDQETIDSNARWTALWTSLIVLALSLVLWVEFDPGESGFQFVESVPWLAEYGVGYKLGVDGISVLFDRPLVIYKVERTGGGVTVRLVPEGS